MRSPLLPRIAVGAIVLHPDGRVLLVRRARPPNAGGFSLPGGKPNPGEALEDAVVREVLEETALEVRVERALGSVFVSGEGYAYDIHEYLCCPLHPEAPAVAGDDASEVHWVRPDELEAYGVNSEAIDLVRRTLAE